MEKKVSDHLIYSIHLVLFLCVFEFMWMNSFKKSSCPTVFWHELHGKMGHVGANGRDSERPLRHVHLFPRAVFPWPTTASCLTTDTPEQASE